MDRRQEAESSTREGEKQCLLAGPPGTAGVDADAGRDLPGPVVLRLRPSRWRQFLKSVDPGHEFVGQGFFARSQLGPFERGHTLVGPVPQFQARPGIVAPCVPRQEAFNH